MSIIKHVLEGDEIYSWVDSELWGDWEFNYSVRDSIFLFFTNGKLVIHAFLTI